MLLKKLLSLTACSDRPRCASISVCVAYIQCVNVSYCVNVAVLHATQLDISVSQLCMSPRYISLAA
uniref:Uncharacterized protein n=1 Tax=Arion vulgaris TaxID=1028688 RepID=A0A0B6ZRI7_9EUPU